MGAKADNPFAGLDNLAPEVYTIGDAQKARSAVEAIYEGLRDRSKNLSSSLVLCSTLLKFEF